MRNLRSAPGGIDRGPTAAPRHRYVRLTVTHIRDKCMMSCEQNQLRHRKSHFEFEHTCQEVSMPLTIIVCKSANVTCKFHSCYSVGANQVILPRTAATGRRLELCLLPSKILGSACWLKKSRAPLTLNGHCRLVSIICFVSS